MGRKFLDDIGYVDELAGLEDDPAYDGRFTKQQEIYGFDDRDTWNLHIKMAELLYERLKMYDMVNIVNTEFHTIDHRGKTITMQQALDLMINLAAEVLTSDSNEYLDALNDAEDKFFDIHWDEFDDSDNNDDSLEDDGETYSEPVPATPFQWTKEGYWFFKRKHAIEMDAYWAEKELWDVWAKTHMYFWW